MTVILLLGLLVWGVLQLAWAYPSSFFPRFADEAVYALDVQVTSTLFADYQPYTVRYAPAKLGYGLPLAGFVVLFGPDGAMYFSTLMWLATLAVIGIILLRRVGVLAAVIACSFALFNPVFGKYATEVGPTTLEAFGFVLLWATAGQRRFWQSGLCLGLIAFVDFKWAFPAALAFVAADFIAGTPAPLRTRITHIASSGLVAVGFLGLAMALHPAYAAWLSDYAGRHSKLFRFEPSPILVYYLWLFKALPAVAVATVLGVVAWRDRSLGPGAESRRCAGRALTIALIPILFHSLFGAHKALRFFAVLFPLVTVAVGVQISGFIRALSERPAHRNPRINLAGQILIPLVTFLVVYGGADGPARHLSLTAGFPEALARLRSTGAEGGSINSYNWEVVRYGWGAPTTKLSFAFWGTQATDRWIMLDDVLDRVTVEYHLRLAAVDIDPDSAWIRQRNAYLEASDSLFSVRNDFYASDYFLCELAPQGIGVLQRWRTFSPPGGSFLTVRQFKERKRRVVQPSGK